MSKNPKLPTLDIQALEAKALDPDHQKSSHRLARRKLKILRKSNYQCEECGSTNDLTIDHEPPLKKGKNRSHTKYFRTNDCRALCEQCHMKKNGWVQ